MSRLLSTTIFLFLMCCGTATLSFWLSTTAVPPSKTLSPARTDVPNVMTYTQPRHDSDAEWTSEAFLLPPVSSSSSRCGWGLLHAFGVRFQATRVNLTSFLVEISSSNSTDVWLVGRALGPVIVAAQSHVVRIEEGRRFVAINFDRALLPPGSFSVDIVATWVADRYLGQAWSLPNRNDDPPEGEKKRKCLALTLSGECDRFGVTLFNGTLNIKTAETPSITCDWRSNGRWMQANNGSPLLNDFVGLNQFRGSVWEWYIPGCPSVLQNRQAVLDRLQRHTIKRFAIIGDSMMVELFNALHAFLGDGAPVTQGKFKRLRSMEFEIRNVLHVKFFRSYTTSGGHSIIADPRVVIEQLKTFTPDVVVGNLAVLHWQQNMRSVGDWSSNVVTFAERFNAAFPALSGSRAFYVGPTLIQMGRTQGLQPRRTTAFAEAARTALRGTMKFIDVFNASVARRESSYDGQHWACYHRYGGVSHVLAQLALRQVLL